jgi:hypothetical protein
LSLGNPRRVAGRVLEEQKVMLKSVHGSEREDGTEIL